MNLSSAKESKTFLILNEKNMECRKNTILLVSFFLLRMFATFLDMQNSLKILSLSIAAIYFCFMLPCSKLFDNIGFKYILNFSIFIFFFRFILLENLFREKEFYCALFFLILDICLLFLRVIFSFSFLLASFSSFISYSLMILFLKRVALPMLASDLTPLSLLFLLGSYKAMSKNKEDFATLIVELDDGGDL